MTKKSFFVFLATLLFFQFPSSIFAQQFSPGSVAPDPNITTNGGCAAGFIPVQSVGAISLNDVECVPNNETGSTPASPTSCDGVNFAWNFPICMGRQLAVWIGELAIYLTGWLLGISAVFFNYAVDLTIAGFDSQIYANVRVGIEAVWTTFRDIANILIIGMFTFIALSMILGIEKFNAKQMVAKVLVIAILINFSLLFTRLIISSSNFVATQFYNAALVGTMPEQGVTAATSFGKYQVGISGRFAQLMGVTSFAETDQALWKTATATDNGWITLLLGIVSAIIFMVTALFFFYASFLLIARAILFIILLITSSLAFASYLIPGVALGGFGWKQWWSSLLQNAIFGPLLLIMLWATIQLGEGIVKINSSNGKLGDLLSNAANQGGINALFSYLMILGMLYASIKIASSFSGKIGGFSYAAMAPAYGAGILARFGGAVGRNTIGRGLSIAASSAEAVSQNDQRSLGARQFYDRAGQILQKGAKRDFNILKGGVGTMNLGKEIQKAAGFKKLEDFAGKDIGGRAGSDKTKAEAYAAQAERITPKLSKDERAAAEKKAREAAHAENPTLAREKADVTQVLKSAEASLAEAQKKQTDATNAFTEKLKDMRSELSAAQGAAFADPDHVGKKNKASELAASIEREKSQHKASMNEQAIRIKEATEATARAREDQRDVHARVDKILTDTITQKLPKSVAETGSALANKRLTNIFRTAEKDDELAQKTRKAVGDRGEKKRLREQIAVLRDEDTKNSPPVAAPAAPSTPKSNAH